MGNISLNSGNGGKEMQEFLGSFLPNFYRGDWRNSENDSATLKISDGNHLCFTTDSFVVDPIEFPGGNIGDLAVAGTVNDLVVMGARPLGISLALIIEENFLEEVFKKILKTIQDLSEKYQIPISTGDTKIMEKGSLDGIVINTSGVGIAEKVLEEKIQIGDKIILSGGIGEHGVALLSKRFDFQTDIISDSKPLLYEMSDIKDLVKIAKDPTRGGIASTLNEIASSQKFEFEIIDKQIPMKKAVKASGELLGIDVLSLANEGKILCFASPENAEEVVKRLQKYNPMACVFGEVKKENPKGKIVLKTELGSRILMMPSGKIVPRIC